MFYCDAMNVKRVFFVDKITILLELPDEIKFELSGIRFHLEIRRIVRRNTDHFFLCLKMLMDFC